MGRGIPRRFARRRSTRRGGGLFRELYRLSLFSGCGDYCVYQTYNAGAITRTAISIARAGNPPRWVAFFGDSAGFSHAVDAETGRPLWKTKLDEHPAARSTGAPVFYEKRAYVPVASGRGADVVPDDEVRKPQIPRESGVSRCEHRPTCLEDLYDLRSAETVQDQFPGNGHVRAGRRGNLVGSYGR